MRWSDPTAFQDDFGARLAAPELDGVEPALARALAIHRNTAAKAAIDALGANYTVVRALVGDDAFTGAALAYVEAHPPNDPRLHDFGEAFALFLSEYSHFAEIFYLPDCARVERAATEALFAADAPVATGEDFAQGIDPKLVLTPHPALRLVSCTSPAASIWRAHQPGSDQRLESLEWAEEMALITRPQNAVHVFAVTPAAATLVEQVLQGTDLAGAAAAAAEVGDLSAAFLSLLAAGAFARPQPGM